MPFVHQSRVRFADTDASGRIHFTAMLRHFEASEHEFLRSIGSRYVDIIPTGVTFPRVHVECDYTSVVAFDDLMDIEVRVEKVGNSSFTLAYSASVSGRPVAHGKITIVCVDIAAGKSRPLPEELAKKLREQMGF